MIVSLVKKDDIELFYPAIYDYMNKCAVYTNGRFDANDIKDHLLEHDQQLWIAYEDNFIYGAVVTEITKYPKFNALTMHFTGGIKLPKWKQAMLSTLQRFARDAGCKVIESHGRTGWGKVFKHDGYKPLLTFYELPVEAI